MADNSPTAPTSAAARSGGNVKEQGDSQQAGAADRGRRWSFGAAVFDERTLGLTVDGREVELERKPLEVLRVLLAHAGEVVTKDQIVGAVWPGRFLSDTVLTKSISRIREALGDHDQSIVKTSHGYGYRLAAPVQVTQGQQSAASGSDRHLDILLVDDHDLFRAGVKLLLTDLSSGIQFTEASTCAAAIAAAANRKFDIVLLDFHLPGLQGFDALRAVRASIQQAVIVVLSGEDDPALIRRVIDEGAAGFIPKASTHAVMLAALRLVLAGGTYLPPHALLGLQGTAQPGPAHGSALDDLTLRQIEALRLAVQGKSDQVIAAEMKLGEDAVRKHLAASFRALGVENRTDAVFAAARAGLTF